MALGKIIATAALLIITSKANAQFHFAAEADFTEEITDGKTINIVSKGHSRYSQLSQKLVTTYINPTTATITVNSEQPQLKYSILYRAVNNGFATTPAVEFNYKPVSVEKKDKSVIITYMLDNNYTDTLNTPDMVVIILTSQTNNRLDAEVMYDINNKIISKTFYYDYQITNGTDIPTRIISVSYGKNEIYSKTIYTNIEIDKQTAETAEINILNPSGRNNKCEYEVKKNYNGIFAFYKRIISPQDIQKCSFYPSCSEYSIMTMSQNGFFYGFADTFDRLIRCSGADHSKYEFDPKHNLHIDYPLNRKK